MFLKIEIESQNAPFDGYADEETARILRALADKIEHGHDYTQPRIIRDTNGNDVGRIIYNPDA